MAVEGIWFWFIPDFYAHGDAASWSVDLNIPEQTVHASAALSRYDNSQAGFHIGYVSYYAFCGILSYLVVEKVGAGSVLVPRFPSSGSNEQFVPAIMDNNVVTVSFGYGATNTNADCHFRIMGFGQ
jgi:hypothetical protein